MSFKSYVYLARLLAKSNDPEHVVLHLFHILDWQMVSRAEGVVDQHMDLFGVYEDALLVHMFHQKVIKTEPNMQIILGIFTHCLRNQLSAHALYLSSFT